MFQTFLRAIMNDLFLNADTNWLSLMFYIGENNQKRINLIGFVKHR